MLDKKRGEQVDWKSAPLGFDLQLTHHIRSGRHLLPPVPHPPGWLGEKR